jgi:hypothetical protein
MTKRKKFLLSSLLLSLGFVGVQSVPDQYRVVSIVLLSLSTAIFTYWCLKGGLGWDMTLMVFILPLFFTIGVGFFWFLLPISILTQIFVVVLYAIGIYVLYLTSNIFTVSTFRTIALVRAARGVGFVLTLLTLFFIFDTTLSLKWQIYYTSAIVFLVSVPLFLQGFWAFDLERTLSEKLLPFSFVSSLVVAEVSSILFFWPVGVAVGSLFLTAACYILLGLGQAEIEGRLFNQTVREFLVVGLFVLVGMFLVTSWSA